MSKKKMKVAVNRSTKELIGYTTGNESIVVTAYAMDDLQKKFNAVLEKRKKQKEQRENYHKNIEHLAGQDQREVELMIQSSKI